jgi:hypothetical protein
VLVSAVGQLNRPATPDIPGLETFRGVAFHSARWRHDVELAGKNVAVIGNAASAIQLIPQIAPVVRRLSVFQRSANWMIAKNDRAYSAREHRRFARFPFLTRLYRWWLWATYEMRFPVFRQNALMSRKVTRLAEDHIREHVADPALQRGARPRLSGRREAHPHLRRLLPGARPRQRRRRDEPDRARHRRRDRDPRRPDRPADVIVLATGFETTSFLVPMRIEGTRRTRPRRGLARRRRSVTSASRCPASRTSSCCTAQTRTSAQLDHLHDRVPGRLRARLHPRARGARPRVDRRPTRGDARFNARLQAALERTVWAKTGKSWYKRADGRITNNWSGSTVEYWWRTRRADLERYHVEARARRVQTPVAKVA